MLTSRLVWFSVRSRALASFLSGIMAMTAGNGLGVRLDYLHPLF